MRTTKPFTFIMPSAKNLLEEALDQIYNMQTYHAEAMNLIESEWRDKFEKILKSCCNAEAEVEFLQTRLEQSYNEILDLKEIVDRTGASHLSISMELETLRTLNDKANKDQSDEVLKLRYDLANLTDNYQFAKNHINDQNALLEKTKKIFEDLRNQNEALKRAQVDAEHLAKKLLELNNEKTRLTSENLTLKNLVDTFSCPFQRTKDTVHIRCGKCTSCKLEAAYGIIDRSAENVSHLEETINTTKSILDTTIKNLVQVREDRDGARAELKSQLQLQQDRHYVTVTEQAREIDFLKEIIRAQETALETVAEGSFFGHAGIAQGALDRVKKMRDDKKDAQFKTEMAQIDKELDKAINTLTNTLTKAQS